MRGDRSRPLPRPRSGLTEELVLTWALAFASAGCGASGPSAVVATLPPEREARAHRSSTEASTEPSTEPSAAVEVGLESSDEESVPCVQARRLWFDDFETGDSSRWTGSTYDPGWGNACQSNATSSVHPHSGLYDQRSEIVCRMRGRDAPHRGYGGLQFSGDDVLPEYTNTGSGIDAPHGIVTTFWSWLEGDCSFGDGRWVSLFSVFSTCDYTEPPITLGIDQPDGILRAAHWWPEGTSRIEPGAPPLARGRWVRITVHLRLATGEMHTWQDGHPVEHVTGIVRASHRYCQWHWGLYASGDNDDLVLFEDDKVIWKLEQPWTDFTREPWLAETQPVCDG